MAQAYEIKRHFQGLRVETGRRKSRRDPFAETFDDDSDGDTNRRSRSTNKQSPPAEKEKSTKVAPAKTSAPLPSAAEIVRDNDDESLEPPKRTDRRPSPAPSQLLLARSGDGAGRRGSLDKGLQAKGLQPGRGTQISKAPRSAVAQAAGSLAYLDDSDEEDEVSPARLNRYPSPAPRKKSDPSNEVGRSSTPKGSREPTSDAFQAASLPSQHTVASPFAGTKYLQDSESDSDEDEDEEAVTSRSNSVEDVPVNGLSSASSSPDKQRLDVQRVDKPKQNGSGVSWRAFSAGRAEQRHTEIEALQASLRHRGKSISFGTHAVTDDGNRVPVTASPEQIFGGIRGRKPRGKSPPRRAEDTKPTDDEILDGGPVGVYDPTQFKTNPFTDVLAPIQTGTPIQQSGTATANDLPMASLTSGSTISPTSSDGPASPNDTGGLENSTGSLTGKMTISPPKTIPEGKPIDLTSASPMLSPTEEMMISPLSRNSSARSMRMSRPTRIPGAQARRSSRRSNSANHSVSPAHAFLSSWSTNANAAAAEPVEPNPDDEGQAFGLNNEYIIGRTIGQGGFGVVKEAHTITAGDSVVRAVKIVRKTIPGRDELENDKAQQELEHEVSIWRHLKHRHVLDLHAVYDTDFATFCVMDLNVGGTLFDIVRKARMSASENNGRKGLDPKLARNYAYQLASALRYLHEDIRVCHRDVKLENCLIDMSGSNAESEGGNLRLCDFGLADFLHSETMDDAGPELVGRRFQRGTASQVPTTSSVIGTLEYASPKGLSVNRKLFETAGDVWAFGVIVYALCTGDLPFRHAMPSKTVEMIMQADWDDNALTNAAAGGSEAKELVQGCLEKDVDIRLTIGEALRSTWFDGCKEALGEEDASGDGVWQ